MTDLNALALYQSRQCTIIAGDLFISHIPLVTKKTALRNSLGSIRTVRGFIYVLDNPYLTALTHFSMLQHVKGFVLLNNPFLVDARMPGLLSMAEPAVVTGCDRLCPARYPVVGASPEDVGCTNPVGRYPMHIVGFFDASQVQLLAPVFERLLKNVTLHAVWCLL